MIRERKLSLTKFFLPSILLFGFFLHSCNTKLPDGKRDETVTFFDTPKDDVLPYFRGKDLEPFWKKKEEIPPDARGVDSFSFIDQNDRTVTQDILKKKITVVSFFFAKCHGICPNIIRNLKHVQEKYGTDPGVQILSFSVTPDLDTPAELRKFAGEKGILSEKWTLLTGDREKIFRIGRSTFQADTDAASDKVSEKDFVHSERIYLIDGNLRFRGVYNGNKMDSVETLIQDIKVLEKKG